MADGGALLRAIGCGEAGNVMTWPEDQTFHRFFQEVCDRAPRALALSTDGKPYTYEELWETSGCLARSLLKADLGPGERIGLWLPNGVEYILGLLAVSRVGAVAIPLNTRFRQDDLSFLLQHSKLTMLMCPGTFLQTDYPKLLRQLAPDLKPLPNGECSTSHIPSLKRILAVADTPGTAFCSFWSFIESGRDLPTGEAEQVERSIHPDDTYILMYTSGSIATPKGVLLKHSSCARKPIALAERLKLRADDRFYTAMPLSHAAGLFSGWWLAVAVGGPLFTHSRFDPRETLRTMSEEGITVERSFPTLVMDQLAVAEEGRTEYDLSKLRTGLSSSLNTDVFEKLDRVIGTHEYVNNYGFTEATGVVCLSYPEDPPEVRWGKMGKPLDGMEVQIVSPETGMGLGTGEEGEILVRGWAMMKGYHDPGPDVPPAFDTHGWYHTGDLGQLDREGYLTYLGRVQERLRVGGENVVPEEVSVFLRRHPEVEAAEVFGIPDERLGEVPAAVIQRKPGASFSASEVHAYCRDRIASFKIPQHIRFVDQMPISASYKVDRRKLRQEMLEGLGIEM